MFVFHDRGIFQLDTLLKSDNPIRNTFIFSFMWLITLTAVFLASISQITAVRFFWATWFAISVFCYATFASIFGYPPTLGDAKTLWLETGQLNAAFLFYWSDALKPFTVAIVLFTIFVLPIRPIKLLRSKVAVFGVMVLPFVPMLMLSGMLVIKGGGAGVGMPAGFLSSGSFLGAILYESSVQPNIQRSVVTYEKTTQQPVKNIVLIVDESVSADFVSLNTKHTLTPTLAAFSKHIIDYGHASSGHGCSSFSNIILRWGITENNLNIAETLPTIWQYAKAAGYTTTYIDSQTQPGTYYNFMNLDEAKYIDSFVQFKSPQIERHNDYISNDQTAAEGISRLIASDTSNFIYLNKLGAHVPYEGKYPEKEAKFYPHMTLFEPVGNTTRERLVNSYKNVISWNLENFFGTLLSDIDLNNTVIIYTSDHGQNLLDEGKATHCNYKSSRYQALVPLLVLTESKVQLNALSKYAAHNKNKTSHFNIFPSVLSLMGYPKNLVEKDYLESLYSPLKKAGKVSAGNLLEQPPEARDFRWMPIDLPLEERF